MEDWIEAAVRRELGEKPESIEKVTEGLVHRTYSIECGNQKYILQFSEDREKRDSISLCLEIYMMLENSDIPVPETVTRELRKYRDRHYMIVKKTPGRIIEDRLTPRRVRESGWYLARIHGHMDFEEDGWLEFDGDEPGTVNFEEGGLKQRTLEKVEEDAGIFESQGREELAASIRRFFDRHGDTLPGDFEPVLCHNDYSPDNILFQGDELTGIIDWDYAYAGHAQRDLVKAATAFWMNDPGADWNIRKTFYDGYREVREPGPGFEKNREVYRVEILARIVASLYELDAFEERNGPYFAERIPEIIDQAEDRLREDE